MKRTTTLSIACALASLTAASCEDGGGAGGPDGGADTDSQTDTGTDTDTDISDRDCVFDLAEGPFEIATVDTGHIAFPDVARLPTGELLLVYRRATAHGVDTSGAIAGRFGTSDGLDWSPEETLIDVPGVDDRDPSVATLANGDLALSYFQYVYQTTADGSMSVHQIFYSRSGDDGETWSAPAMVPQGDGVAMEYADAGIGADDLWRDGDGAPVIVTACSNDPVEVGGEIIVQSYGGYGWNQANPAAPRSRISLYATDDGEAWEERAIAPEEETATWLQEPALLALDEDRWIVHLRTAAGASPGNPGAMWQIRSFDGGETWGAFEKLDFVGHAPYLARLSNGALVSAFRWLNDAYTSTNVGFIWSTDDGDTWSDITFILEPQTVEVGYPSILELEDDRVLIVYYVGGKRIEGVIYEVSLVEP